MIVLWTYIYTFGFRELLFNKNKTYVFVIDNYRRMSDEFSQSNSTLSRRFPQLDKISSVSIDPDDFDG